MSADTHVNFGETISTVRRLGVIVTVAMTLTLAVCTSSSAQPKSFPSSAIRRRTSTTTVSRAELSRFVALAHKGLREPFEAAHPLVPPLGKWGDQLHNFRALSEPPVGSDSEGNFVYEAPFGRGTFRFIQKKNGDYECLERPQGGHGSASGRSVHRASCKLSR